MKNYIAYGSNMDPEQMHRRCPGAYLVGTGTIHGWEMFFKGSKTGSYATIEPGAQTIPVYIWSISKWDEHNLDIYEGFPRFYIKKNIEAVLDNGEKITGMVYIMADGAQPGLPSRGYFNNILDIYHEHDWDDRVLWDGIDATTKYIRQLYEQEG